MKNFKTKDPNSLFISAMATEEREEVPKIQEEDKAPTPEEPVNLEELTETTRESKTRRVQLVFTPSLFDKIQKAAAKDERSINEYITKAIKEYMKEV